MHFSVIGAVFACLFAAAGLKASAAENPGSKPLVFGVFPYLPPRELEKIFAPMAADFGKVLGKEVEFVSSTSYQIFSKNLREQIYDIAFVQPFDYIEAHDKYGYLPLATRAEPLKALIVTTKDSPIKSIADLRGKRISMPPEEAAVSHLALLYFQKSGLVPGKDITVSHFRSHMSCLQQVLIESTNACATAAPALRYLKSRMNVEMRAVGESDAIPHTLFTINSRVSQEDRDKILQRILGWGKTAEGRDILERGKMTGFVPVSNEAYNVVRKFPRE